MPEENSLKGADLCCVWACGVAVAKDSSHSQWEAERGRRGKKGADSVYPLRPHPYLNELDPIS